MTPDDAFESILGSTPPGFRSGMVAVVGRPNVGKSTLLNTIIGQSVVIVSPRPQTTRHRITCIKSLPDAQLVFLDTPGLNLARDDLHTFMQHQAMTALEGVDVVLLLLDAGVGLRTAERRVIDVVRKTEAQKVVAVNKIDAVPRKQVEALLGELGQAPFWQALVPISALDATNVQLLVDEIKPLLPLGGRLYPEDVQIDRSERFVVSELIREQVFLQTREEIPHATAVLVEEMDEREDGVLAVFASIVVEKESQKGILIGKQGQRMKAIGTAAREKVESLLATRVFLDLRVRVRKNWRKRDGLLRDLGYSE